MGSVTRFSAFVLMAAISTGCANVPSPNYVGLNKDDGGVTVDALVGHLQCELMNAAGFDDLANKRYRVQVILTLKVEDIAGLSPSLSFIVPYSTPSTSLTYGVGGTLSVDRQRIFTTTYTIALEKLRDQAKLKPLKCGPQGETTFNLTGDLGIGGIIASGIDATNYQGVNASAPSTVSTAQNLTVNVILNPNNPATTPPNVQIVPVKPPGSIADIPLPPTFGSTVQFIIVKSANLGPTWALRYFKGPSGSSGLLNAGRTDTDTLLLAFASANSPKVTFLKGNEAAGALLQDREDAAAETRAQSQVQSFTTNMILQNLSSLQGATP